MKQRVITYWKRFTTIDMYGFSLDREVSQLNADGWVVKQIVSTSFVHTPTGGQPNTVMAVTLLVEKPE